MRGSTGQLDKEANSMAYITKRGNSYSVRYTYEDEHGKSCDKWESFPTKEEATNRKKQIEHELAAGTFLIPSSVTVAEFLMDWLPKQCSKHKWAPKTYESNLSTIQNLIIPYIGSMEMQKLKPYHMENLYTTLSKTPCGSYIEGKKQELTKKQKQRFLSGTTIHEVHRLLGTAFQYAVEWGILIKSPVPVDSPKKSTQERIIWTVEEMRAALDSMEDPILHLAVHLTLVGALREGEIVGLTPEDLDFDAADGIGNIPYQQVHAAGAKRSSESSRRWLHHQGIPGQAGAQHYFPYPEKYQNGILLPHHLHDLCTERGIEEVAESTGSRREEGPDTLPRQRNAVPSAQRSGGGAGTHPQKVPEMAGCTPGVPAYRVPRSAAL